MALLPFLVTHDECVVNENSPRACREVEPLCQGRKQTLPATPHPTNWYQGERREKGRGGGYTQSYTAVFFRLKKWEKEGRG